MATSRAGGGDRPPGLAAVLRHMLAVDWKDDFDCSIELLLPGEAAAGAMQTREAQLAQQTEQVAVTEAAAPSEAANPSAVEPAAAEPASADCVAADAAAAEPRDTKATVADGAAAEAAAVNAAASGAASTTVACCASSVALKQHSEVFRCGTVFDSGCSAGQVPLGCSNVLSTPPKLAAAPVQALDQGLDRWPEAGTAH